MSISNLFYPNSYDTFSGSLNTGTLKARITEIAELAIENAEVTGDLISNKITQTTGFNYLSPWDATKSYIVGDMTMINNQLFRCLVANTNVQPNPLDPSQAEWVTLSSNNAILNDLLYIQVSDIIGDDAKALVSPVPFKTIQAALNYAQNGSRIVLVDSESIFINTTALTITGKSDITIDGGVDGIYSQAGNTIRQNSNNIDMFILTDCTNITIKNIILQMTATFPGQVVEAISSINMTFDNVVFDTVDANVSSDLLFRNIDGMNMGDVIIAGCRSKTASPTQYLNIRLTAGTIGPFVTSRLFVLNHIGPVGMGDSSMGGSALNYDVLSQYFFNCNSVVADYANSHLGGFLSYNSCNFITQLNSNASTASANSRLVIIDSTLLNPSTGLYSPLNKSGFCPYLFQNFDYDVNNVVALNATGSTGINYTRGPAKKFNQIALFSSVVGDTNLTSGNAIQVPIPTVITDLNDIVDRTGTTITIKGSGLFQVSFNFDVSTTDDALAGISYVRVWLGPVAGLEPGVGETGYTTPFTFDVITYPEARVNPSILTFSQTVDTIYSVYARNLGAVTSTIRIAGLTVTQVR